MSSLTSGDLTFGTGKTIGQYFGIVSVVPSVAFTGWICLIISTGVPIYEPSLSRVRATLTDAPVRNVILFIIAAIIVALVFHPLQFTIVQLMEGYWGSSALGRRLRSLRTRNHLARVATATATRKRLASHYEKVPAVVNFTSEESGSPSFTVDGRVVMEIVDLRSAEELLGQYPAEVSTLLPTSLGNVLRRYELSAGASVGLPILEYASHLGLVADRSHTDYLNDQRTAMDLAVRMSAMAALAALITSAVMWPHGLWMLTALVPYCAAWLSYRGAVTAAHSYGAGLLAWLNLNRFRLYESLHMPIPEDSAQEITQNAALQNLVRGIRYRQRYAHPAAAQGRPAAEVSVKVESPEKSSGQAEPIAEQVSPDSSDEKLNADEVGES